MTVLSLTGLTDGPLSQVGVALAFLGALAALGVGHLAGDTILQSDTAAQGKGYPSDDRLAAGVHPWTGWGHCLAHCGSYLAAQAVMVAIVAQVVPMTWPGLAAALALSGCTHAVIDRRWPVRWVIARKRCTGWADSHFWIDQAMHWVCLLVAAVLAARVSTGTGAALAAAAGLVLIGDALRYEARHARGVTAGAAPTDRF
ncbi:DUF3307 domain-containing protein [Actinoplanes sp. G11-F43]|uniref:DUF3307 domain-containing protein n=1 Tax=Actinoplanes sp. G11-F43 TaxID=3424130 RepID=UPI003D32998D